jgi:hypothetical protein
MGFCVPGAIAEIQEVTLVVVYPREQQTARIVARRADTH